MRMGGGAGLGPGGGSGAGLGQARSRRGPVADRATATSLDAVVAELAAQRGLDRADPAHRVHLLASLDESLRGQLRAAVDDVRATGLSWTQVGEMFGVSASAAWQRFREVPVEAVPWPPSAD